MPGRSTQVTKLGREKFLVLEMVRDVLEAYFDIRDLSTEGSVQGLGVRPADLITNYGYEASLRQLRALGEYPTTTRFYQFEGKVIVGSAKARRIQVGCDVFQGVKPRAAHASLVFSNQAYWYEFTYYRSNKDIWYQVSKDLYSPDVFAGLD